MVATTTILCCPTQSIVTMWYTCQPTAKYDYVHIMYAHEMFMDVKLCFSIMSLPLGTV